jgi:hypothetical protein
MLDLFINVLITEQRNTYFDRGLLQSYTSLDTFRYMLISLEEMTFRNAVLNVELDGSFYNEKDQELLSNAIQKSINAKKIFVNQNRLLKIGDWKAFFQLGLFDDNTPILYSGNHDHIYISSENVVLNSCIKAMTEIRTSTKFVSIILSHWTEYFSYRHDILINLPFGFVQKSRYRDSMAIYSFPLLKLWIDGTSDPDLKVRRLEDLGYISQQNFIQIVPAKELFRHFDGGSHFGVTRKRVTPLRIPPGLFGGRVNIVIDYNSNPLSLEPFDKRSWFRLGPELPFLCNSDTGVDMKWTELDIPKYMLRRSSELITIGAVSQNSLNHRALNEIESLRDFIDVTPRHFFDTYSTTKDLYRVANISEKSNFQGANRLGRSTSNRVIFKSAINLNGYIFVLLLKSSDADDKLLQAISSRSPISVIFVEHRQSSVWPIQRPHVDLVSRALFEKLKAMSIIFFDFYLDKRFLLEQLELDVRDIKDLFIIDNTVPGMAASVAELEDFVFKMNESLVSQPIYAPTPPLLFRFNDMKAYRLNATLYETFPQIRRNLSLWESINLSDFLLSSIDSTVTRDLTCQHSMNSKGASY